MLALAFTKTFEWRIKKRRLLHSRKAMLEYFPSPFKGTVEIFVLEGTSTGILHFPPS